ncbi:MAG: alpha/beta hydrolase domain-containing protein [Chloroflexi bacterium]|nr:alpha/beta hydrolase domain-containing protein [Chloroflexota bacterium]
MAVVDLQQLRRFPYAEGRKFGSAGAYEQIDAILTFAVDPELGVNRSIVDLALAPRDQNNLIRFTADFSLIRPVDPGRGSNRLLIELPNRGRRRVVDTFNRSGAEAAASPAAGDGFLFRRGLTVASIGWQWDVYADDVLMGLNPPIADLSGEPDPGKTVVEIRPNLRQSTWLLADRIHKPLREADMDQADAILYIKDYEDDIEREIPRSTWRFAKETSEGIVPSDEHIYLDGGFEPGKYYQIVYSTKDAPVAGSGLLALRDATSFLKYGASELDLDFGDIDYAFGYGVSQTGRMLRHFLYAGLNVDEKGRKVFDGLLPHVAGARRGAFNHRYAQPSNQSYPGHGHLFPFADVELTDPHNGGSDGLLSGLSALNAVPKIVYTNSSAEYWRGDCSLMHTDPDGRRDLETDPGHGAGSASRIYHFAGTQHSAGTLPQDRDPGAEGALGRHAYNVVDYSPLLRAALVNLENWVVDGVEPPPSRHARIEDETAVSQGVVLDRFDMFPDQATPDRSKLWVIRTIDMGSRSSEGVGVYPSVEGATYACLVSAVDLDGNEVAGVRLPDITQPVATHAGWNVRDPETGSPDQQVPMLGQTRWFPATRAEREASNDPRLSIEERYIGRAEYAQGVARDTEALIRDGFVLEQDVDLVIENALERYDEAVSRVSSTMTAVRA